MRRSDVGSTTPVSPFATHRLPRVGFPAFNRYYEDTKTASVPSRLRSRLGVQFLRFASAFFATADRKRIGSLGSWSAGVIRSGVFRGDRRLSQLPWRPCCHSALLSGPGRTRYARPLRRSGIAPAPSNTKAPPIIIHFEALSHGFTACCLRLKTPFLVANQGSLPVDGQSLSGGMVPAGSR